MLPKKRNTTPDKWHCLFTTGKPVMTERLSIPATVGNDIETIVVGENERWVLFGGMIKHCTLSSGDSNLFVAVLDENDSLLYRLVYDNAATTTETFMFPAQVADSILGGGGYPIVMTAGQKLQFYWTADAAKSGTGYYFANALQFRVDGV